MTRSAITSRAAIASRLARSFASVGPVVPATWYGANLSFDLNPIFANVTQSSGLISAIANATAKGNAVQATGAKQPAWVASDQEANGNPVVQCTAASQFLTMGTWGSEAQPRTVCMVCAIDSESNNTWLWDTPDTGSCYRFNTDHSIHINAGVDVGTGYGAQFGGQINNQFTSVRDFHVYHVVYNGAKTKFYVDGQLAQVVNTSTAGWTGFFVWARNNSTATPGRWARCYAVNRELTTSEIARDTAALGKMYIPGTVIFNGDSLVSSSFATAGQEYPTDVWNSGALPPFKLHNDGFGGSESGSIPVGSNSIYDALQRFPTCEVPLYNALRPWVVGTWEFGINDCVGGLGSPSPQTTAGFYANLCTYAYEFAAFGGILVVRTIAQPPQLSGANNAILAGYSAAILANVAGAPYMTEDMAANALFANPTYRPGGASGVHFNNAGYLLSAQDVTPALLVAISTSIGWTPKRAKIA